MSKLAALLIAALLTGLSLWAAGSLARPFLTWIGHLDKHDALIFRSVCLLIPILLIGWIMHNRRRNPPRSHDDQ
ncbi:hypothetical protein [Chitinimonas naiadis]